MASMKRLDPETRAQVLHLLMEGISIRAAARLFGVSKTTILKLIEDAGSRPFGIRIASFAICPATESRRTNNGDLSAVSNAIANRQKFPTVNWRHLALDVHLSPTRNLLFPSISASAPAYGGFGF